ncbi:MAG: sigma-54 interaction domain-containing protein, partial [Planctomycetota bacterium]
IGRSAAMRTLLSLLDKVTESTVPVLIEGESGTGKELVARAIHHNGPRARAAFVVENCAAVPDALIENELFGHERGAFTGADRAQEGLFERADGGTIFLDEVGDMSPEMQKKLLRVLQEGEVRRVGGKSVRTVDVRVLCATNRDLVRMVKDGSFREDLFYRLCVVRVRIPPLRDRREDVPLLAAHFLDRIAHESPGGEAPRLEAEALDALAAYGWPGNVRELENEIRRAATLAEGSIAIETLSAHVRETPSRGSRPAGAAAAAAALLAADRGEDSPRRTLKEEVEGLERTLVVDALRATGGNKTHAAAALGLSRLGLRKKMARYGIDG